MKLTFALALPRDAATVCVARHVCRDALEALQVVDDSIAAIEVAVSEACTNVLKHAEGTGRDYEVAVQIDDRACSISVTDTGIGFDYSAFQGVKGDSLSLTQEGGRGLFLLQAMVDQIQFTSEPETGTVVHFVKELDFKPDSLVQQLAV